MSSVEDLIRYKRVVSRIQASWPTFQSKRSAPLEQMQRLAVLTDARTLATCSYVVGFDGRAVRSIKTGFRAACRRADLVGVTPHALRHTAACG